MNLLKSLAHRFLLIKRCITKTLLVLVLMHAMLAAQGVISEEDKQKIVDGLTAIEKRIDEGDFVFDINDEDIHMSIEKVLTENIGDAGARLHTGRSRNDQVVTDTRLYAKELARELMVANVSLREALFEAAEKTFGVILPGYTHMQHAQPVLLSHHFMAYFWMFSRDFKRLSAALDAADMNPLGSAALAGTTYPLDRMATTKDSALLQQFLILLMPFPIVIFCLTSTMPAVYL